MLKRIKNLLERNAVLIALFFTLLVAFFSLVSLKSATPFKVENSDKYGHFIAYFVLSISWFYAKWRRTNTLLLIVLLIAYGIILEALQEILTSNRQADFYDIAANSAGVLLAALLFYKVADYVKGT